MCLLSLSISCVDSGILGDISSDADKQHAIDDQFWKAMMHAP